MILSDIAEQRLYNQHLTRPIFKTPADVVCWFGALQAQDFPGALYAIALRMPSATPTMIEKAVADRAIVRSWPMRGTLHFMAAEDARWMVKLLAPRLDTKMVGTYRKLGLSADVLAQAGTILSRTLRGDKQLPRPELYKAFNAAGIDTGMQAGHMLGTHILGYWAWQGLICIAARQGKQHTVALLDEWIPEGRDLSGDAAMAELATRYFSSHGPATIKDFAWWSGLTITEAKQSLQLVEHTFKNETVDGAVYWFVPKTSAARLDTQAAFLLPPYDEYTVAYADRSAAIDSSILRTTGYGIGYNIIIDGRIVGIWKRTLKKDMVIISAELLWPLDNAQNLALAAAVRRYGTYMQMNATLTVG